MRIVNADGGIKHILKLKKYQRKPIDVGQKIGAAGIPANDGELIHADEAVSLQIGVFDRVEMLRKFLPLGILPRNRNTLSHLAVKVPIAAVGIHARLLKKSRQRFIQSRRWEIGVGAFQEIPQVHF